MKNKICKKEVDFTQWYSDVILKTGLVMYAPVKGTLYLGPLLTRVWENIQNIFNQEFKKMQIENVSFPLLFPKTLLEKEKQHITGFLPECATISKIGDKVLSEELIIRPTSEVLFCDYFKQNLVSYKQLPILLNQWANVVRWEKNTRPFLRTREFFWQEGHTIHETETEALNFSLKMLNLYIDIFEKKFSLAFFHGMKTEKEKFAGAQNTYTIEIMGEDGQCLQSATSHYLAQNFSKTYSIAFSDRNNQKNLAYQTSWGVSTRIIGAIILSHADNNGLKWPWDISPYHFVVISYDSDENSKVHQEAKQIFLELNKTYRCYFDNRQETVSYKKIDWVQKGIPFILEIGEKEIAADSISVLERLHLKKTVIPKHVYFSCLEELIKNYSSTLLHEAKNQQSKLASEANSVKEFYELLQSNKGVIVTCLNDEKIFEQIKKQSNAIPRCIIENLKEEKICIFSNQKTNCKIFFARSY